MVKRLKDDGHDVVGLARNERSKRSVEILGAEGTIADIFDVDNIVKKVGSADVVVHAATSIPTKVISKPEDWAMNDRLRRDGVRSLTEGAAKLGAKTYVQQSVVWVARPPDDSFFDERTPIEQPDPLYASALDAERLSREAGEKYGFNVAILRGGGFYSSDAAHTKLLADGLMKRRVPLIGGGEAVSANIHVDDAADAFVAAALAGKSGLWHVTDDAPVTLKEMLLDLAARLHAPRPRRLPTWIARLFLWDAIVKFFTRSTRTTNELIKRELNWRPRYPSFREGLAQVVAEWDREGLVGQGGAL
jgi:nucleoside-diphosphate-sugar epimerase